MKTITRKNLNRTMLMVFISMLSACGSGSDSDGISVDQPVIEEVSEQVPAKTVQEYNDEMAVFLTNLQGDEASFVYDIEYAFALQGTINLKGYSLCEPDDLYMPPFAGALDATVYGCTNQLDVSYEYTGSNLELTVIMPAMYFDYDGEYELSFINVSLDGYVVASDVTMKIELNLITNNDGTYSIDTSALPEVSIDIQNVSMDTDDLYIDTVLYLIQDEVTDFTKASIASAVAELMQDYIANQTDNNFVF